MRLGQVLRAAAALLAILAAGGAVALEPASPYNYFDDRERGWFWYEDPVPAPLEEEEPEAPPAASAPALDPNSDEAMIARMERFQKRVQASRARAFFNPTDANVREMAALQTSFVQRSSDVADVWQRTIWANPQFDFTQQRPVNPLGLAAYEAENQHKRAATLERLSETHVYYFFFRGDCPYCHAFSPALAAFAAAAGIDVFPVSLDGGALPEFPRPVLDNGMAATLGVETVPALFLADPLAGTIMPVGYGALNVDELAQRTVAIVNQSPAAVSAATPVRQLSERR